ncbi:helix-turn-helix domain-containing protein [Aquimarina sp. AU474]|uniref:helix-turn-helix domain-containing protein n=1 Tax=Aquimarina sp. AU474 TaxID=2108529 RepID=UPI0013568DF1|nr:helix-turn-helix domain-containing protein [Aquimarina sp. AU474]
MNKYLAKKIIQLRKTKGLSQESLAEISNVSLRTIQRIEKGTVNPRSFTLRTLAEALEIKPSELTEVHSEPNRIDHEISLLKQINFSTLGVILFPVFNIILPIIVWKKNKKLQKLNAQAGKIVSFQILWTILTIMIFFSIPLLLKIFTEDSGIGKFMSPLSYLFCVVFNIVFMLNTTIKLNKSDTNILHFVPNLF